MDERIHKWLIDILNAIVEIDLFLENEPKTIAAYGKNLMLKRAVERNLEIIGEAVNRIVIRDPGIQEYISESRNIIGLRNQIIHSYDNISDEIIWSILSNHLPELKKSILIYLDLA